MPGTVPEVSTSRHGCPASGYSKSFGPRLRSAIASGPRTRYPPSGYFVKIIALRRLAWQSETAGQTALFEKSQHVPPRIELARTQSQPG
jgi:hypothetical protein